MAIGFLFLGGGMRTFSTSNSAVAALLIALYPRLPTGPNDNRCHLQVFYISELTGCKHLFCFLHYLLKMLYLQAFRHLYVLATESRWVQTVDVDTTLPVYVPMEITIAESHHAETSFCEVTPCILPARSVVCRCCLINPFLE